MKVALILCNDMHMDIDKANILLNKLLSKGHKVTSDYTDADTVIVYTCAFGPSKMYSMRVIADVCQNAKSSAEIIVTGCLLNLNYEELKAISRITVEYFDDLLKEIEEEKTTKKVRSMNAKNEESDVCSTCSIPQNNVIISEGCLHRCTYCVYPKLFPEYKSKPMHDVLEEVKKLYDTESVIYITGAQETSDYGVDLYGKRCFAELIDKIATDFLDSKFVIGWFHPSGLTDEVISAIGKHTNIIEIMLHIQHVSPHILKEMGRPEITYVDERIEKLKQANPNIKVSTEVIVGFPGESDTDFENLVSYLESRDFYDIGVASFEPVLGTKAYDMPNQIDRNIKMERLEYIKNYFDATVYPADEGSATPVLGEFIKAINKLKKMPKFILNNRQKYNDIAGVDTSDKLEDFTKHLLFVCDLITNARSEFDKRKVRKYLTETYTPSARKMFCDIIESGDFKVKVKERTRNLLL